LCRDHGAGDAEQAALDDHQASPLFSEPERAALAYADAMTLDTQVSGDLFDRARRGFSDDQIVELTAAVAFEICAAKFNRALEIETAGLRR